MINENKIRKFRRKIVGLADFLPFSFFAGKRESVSNNTNNKAEMPPASIGGVYIGGGREFKSPDHRTPC